MCFFFFLAIFKEEICVELVYMYVSLFLFFLTVCVSNYYKFDSVIKDWMIGHAYRNKSMIFSSLHYSLNLIA